MSKIFWFSVNKIKFLKFDSVCFISVYPPKEFLEHNYEFCAGKKWGYSARGRELMNRLYKDFYFFTSTRQQQSHIQIIRRLLNILFKNYRKNIRANLRFVQMDNSNGRFKRKYLNFLGLIQISAANSTAYSKMEEVIYTFTDILN